MGMWTIPRGDDGTESYPPEEIRAFIDGLAAGIVRRGLAVPAVLALELTRPLAFLGSQTLITLGPLLECVVAPEDLGRTIQLLSRDERVEALLRRIEALESGTAVGDTEPEEGKGRTEGKDEDQEHDFRKGSAPPDLLARGQRPLDPLLRRSEGVPPSERGGRDGGSCAVDGQQAGTGVGNRPEKHTDLNACQGFAGTAPVEAGPAILCPCPDTTASCGLSRCRGPLDGGSPQARVAGCPMGPSHALGSCDGGGRPWRT